MGSFQEPAQDKTRRLLESKSLKGRIKMVSTSEGVRLIAAETGRLKQYVNGTDSDEWALNSPCEGWTGGDVIGHLGWAADFFADAISNGRNGITSPPKGLPEAGSIPPEELPGFIADKARRYKHNASHELPSAFSSSVDRLQDLFSTMKEGEWDKECWGFRMVQPASVYVTTRISEITIHSWDIRFPSDPNTNLAPESVAVVIERLPVWLDSVGLSDFKSDKGPERYRLLTTGGVDFQRDIVVGGVSNRVETVQDEPTATITCDANILALLVWGRLNPSQVIADGRLTMSGGPGKGSDFFEWLSR